MCLYYLYPENDKACDLYEIDEYIWMNYMRCWILKGENYTKLENYEEFNVSNQKPE